MCFTSYQPFHKLPAVSQGPGSKRPPFGYQFWPPRPPKGRGGVPRRGLPAAKRAVSLGEVGVEGSCDMNGSLCRVDSLARFRGQLYELSAGGDKRCLSVHHAPGRRFGSIYQLAQGQSRIAHCSRLFLLANSAQAIARHALRMEFLD